MIARWVPNRLGELIAQWRSILDGGDNLYFKIDGDGAFTDELVTLVVGIDRADQTHIISSLRKIFNSLARTIRKPFSAQISWSSYINAYNVNLWLYALSCRILFLVHCDESQQLKELLEQSESLIERLSDSERENFTNQDLLKYFRGEPDQIKCNNILNTVDTAINSCPWHSKRLSSQDVFTIWVCRMQTFVSDQKQTSNPDFRRAFPEIFRILDKWQCNPTEQCILLGINDQLLNQYRCGAYPTNIDCDTLERMSYILNINKSLKIIFSHMDSIDNWIRKPSTHPYFNGKSALDIMLHGNVTDLHNVTELTKTFLLA